MGAVIFTDKFDYLYVEPTSFCNLKCPRCPRTFSPEAFTPTHLKEHTFLNFLDSTLFNDLKIIEYGGNYGDPIFHPRLTHLLKEARRIHPNVQQILHTNGSRSPKWWAETLCSLNSSDMILFSIDGLADTNSIYRKGSHWHWIEEAVQMCSEQMDVIWKFIVFKHNQDQILEAINLAQKWGVKRFYLTKSSSFYGKWTTENGEDPLAPNTNWMAKHTEVSEFEPKCQIGSRHYLAATGEYSPCCWINFGNEYNFKVDDFNQKNSLMEIMNSTELSTLKSSWKQSDSSYCHRKCKNNNELRTSHNRLDIDLSLSTSEIEKLVLGIRD